MKNSIRHEIFRDITILSFVILVFFGFTLTANFYLSKLSEMEIFINQKNLSLKYYIEGYFTKFINTVNFLSISDNVIHANNLSDDSKQDIRDLYHNLEKSDPDINYIYSGYEDGSLLINNYEPPEGYNPVIRPWYQAALESFPHVSNGIPYREISTKEWLISISKALVDKDGHIAGVVAIDSSISQIAALLRRQDSAYQTLYSFLINRDGLVIIHPNEEYLNRNLQEILGIEVLFPGEKGPIIFKNNGVNKLGYYRRIDKVGWIIITIIDKKEIVEPILLKMLIIFLAVGLIAALLGWFLSNTMKKHFVEPLRTLRNRVSVILSGDIGAFSLNNYPRNEIGDIAADIEKLTGNELYKKNQMLLEANRRLERLSFVDQLTGLYNRRKMNEELAGEFERLERYGGTFSLIMFDIDWFKKVNDTYGHQTGDRVLQELAQITRNSIRKTDTASRWGGEEFLILCPQTPEDNAYELAEKLLLSVRNHVFPESISLTISIGLCEYISGLSVEELIENADTRLYAAKQGGRNRVVAEEVSEGT